jgi:hypothetical protein
MKLTRMQWLVPALFLLTLVAGCAVEEKAPEPTGYIDEGDNFWDAHDSRPAGWWKADREPEPATVENAPAEAEVEAIEATEPAAGSVDVEADPSPAAPRKPAKPVKSDDDEDDDDGWAGHHDS